MKNINLFGKTVVSIAVLAAFGVANAATNGRANAVGGTNASRMPVMPTVTLNTIGNPAVHTISTPSGVSSDGVVTPVKPNPNPNPNSNPNPNPNPDPSNCPDGGVENSTYTVAMCMDDLLQCVNTGALQGGINDLFNADVRNSIMGGMRLCQSVIDKCISEVRVNCHNIYAATTDVWLDFNSRVIQPEYYNFVLRKTGLTPNQAENTCLLLDRNTYGESFASVSDANVVNTEYNNYVGAYNRQMNNTLSKNNPQGVEINTTGYDGNRGHYARWDAANAECLIRVAAYNKDNLITNKWLGIGDDTPAEVWQKAGSTFTCNKDLFDFSLMNQTKSAALIGVPAGTVLGTTIGAAAGAGAYNKKVEDYGGYACDNKAYRDKLAEYFRKNQRAASKIRQYFEGSVVSSDLYEIDENECKRIQDLWDIMADYEAAVQRCEGLVGSKTEILSFQPQGGSTQTLSSTEYQNQYGKYVCSVTQDCGTNAGAQVSSAAQNIANECSYVSLLKGLDTGNIYCKNAPDSCVNANQIKNELRDLKSLLSGIEPLMAKTDSKLNKGKEIGKGAAIGAVTGASAGGLATAITALVEKNNISCKVGDGLNTVSLGKSHTIDSLKDFYVKWNLRLPDTVSPTSVVSDVASWQQACSQFNSRLMDCPYVQVNLQTQGSSVYQLVQGACVVSGSVCIPNASVMNSHLLVPVINLTPVVHIVQ